MYLMLMIGCFHFVRFRLIVVFICLILVVGIDVWNVSGFRFVRVRTLIAIGLMCAS